MGSLVLEPSFGRHRIFSIKYIKKITQKCPVRSIIVALIAKETLTQATAMAPIATPTPTQAAKPLDATSMMAMATDSTNRLINPLAITVFTKILLEKDLTLLLDLATAALKNEKFA